MFRRWMVVSLALLTTGCGYNRIQELDERAQAYQGQIEVQLQRRADLIGNLVETVKGYAAHERTTFEAVTAARASAVADDGTPAEQSQSEGVLVGALRSLLAVSEAYPDLKASTSFLDLQRQLIGTEDRLQAARRFYNNNVRAYNERVQSVPSNLVAAAWGFRRHDYFELEAAVREAGPPRVEAP